MLEFAPWSEKAKAAERYKTILSVSPEVQERSSSKKCQNVTELNATLTPQRGRND